jgi:hypothetical protein
MKRRVIMKVLARNKKRAAVASAGLLSTVAGTGTGAAVAEIVTVTTTQQYGPTPMSYDVLFTPVQSATDLVSISDGSVYTGEAASIAIKAITTNDTTIDLFPTTFMPAFQTKSLVSITNNAYADFAPQDIKGLRFTLSFFAVEPSLTLPTGTQFAIAAVPEPGTGLMLACGLAAVLIGRRFTKGVSAKPKR